MELLLDVLKWSVIVGAAALALTLLKPLLDKRYSAKWRYGVWLVMAVFLLLAPVQWETLVPEAPVTPPVVIEVPQMEVSVSRQEGLSIQRPAVTPVARPVGTAAAAAAVENRPAVIPLDKILTGLWLAGMGLFFVYYLFGTWYFNRKARRWSQCAGEDTLRVYEAVWREMELKKAPPLRVSAVVDSPMVIGLFRSCLLLPGEDFAAQELMFILRHELTHYRRRDLWYKLVLLAANGMHWFNLLAYLLRREAERDLELTCDDAVVAGRDALERRAYSEALLGSIHRQKGLGRAVLSTHFYGGKEVMMERFRNILGNRGRKWGVLALALALLATVAAACTFGVKPSTDGELSAEELAAWQERVESLEMDHYIWRMYTDTAYLPSEEKLDEIFPVPEGREILGHEDINPKVLSGTKSGDTVTLEIEGTFASRLPTGTLTLVNDEPVSFTTPLYTAVEAVARELMEAKAESYISAAKEYASKELTFTEKYITSLFCSESFIIDGRTYYIWELHYRMKSDDAGNASAESFTIDGKTYYAWEPDYRMEPDDNKNIFFAGGLRDDNGWITEIDSIGSPVLIFSVDETGNITHEETASSTMTWEERYTWEEYIYCAVHLGMGEMYRGILGGWPELNTPFLESLRDGHDTWALDWQDVAISYLSNIYGIYADSGISSLRTFKADPEGNGHDEAVLAQAVCGDRTATLLLAHVCYPVEVWDTTMTWWQVVGVKWEPDAPAAVIQPEEPETPDGGPQPGELTADELDYFASYFNSTKNNGLLRVPYGSLYDVTPAYLHLMLYDMGTTVTDEEELAAIADLYDGELFGDCMKLTREDVSDFLDCNFYHDEFSMEEQNELINQLGSTMNRPEGYEDFYMVHGDTMMANYTFDRGTRDESGWVRLYYTADLFYMDEYDHLDILFDQPMCATMVLIGNDMWGMIYNLPVTE